MRKIWWFFLPILCSVLVAHAQQKPLDHSVYDGWQYIGEKLISDDGQIVAYVVAVQEGDGNLVITQANGKQLLTIPRGYNAKISADAAFLICKIKPGFMQTRDAKIKKKKPDELPKDSLAIVRLKDLQVEKIARVKTYKMPEDAAAIVAVHLDKNENDKKTDEEGTTLFWKNLTTNMVDTIQKVTDYVWDKKGNNLVVKQGFSKKDATKTAIVWVQTTTNTKQILQSNFADARGLVFDEAGQQLAFCFTNDTTKTEQKNYTIQLFKQQDKANLYSSIDSSHKSIPNHWRLNEFATLSFSKSGQRLFLGTSPKLPIKDTSLPEFERVSVDVWHYQDDDLQTVQLKNIETDLKKSYLAVYHIAQQQLLQLGNDSLERIATTQDGDGTWFFSSSDAGNRVAQQWQGYTYSNVYAINAITGKQIRMATHFKGSLYPSYTGKYALLYEERSKQYSCFNTSTASITKVARDIPFPLYDEDNDVPDDPNAYGIAKWMQEDQYVLVYDRFDVWKVDPTGKEKSMPITSGRKTATQYRTIQLDAEEKYLTNSSLVAYRLFNEKTKHSGYHVYNRLSDKTPLLSVDGPAVFAGMQKAKQAISMIYTAETPQNAPNVFVIGGKNVTAQLSAINPQQSNYNWLTASLFTWKAYTGKSTEGILYKPANFDPQKKYPMIVYFYERNNQTLYNYQAPTPTPSRLNIPYFVSNGYIVFVPDIWYTTGKPAQSAYDYIVSGTRAVVKLGFVDSTKIGLQGQSWGGYQTAQLITMTNLYKAAWAGAPVANMFSAYGGIRWESGLNRQFQYEHTQSRIGATIWQKPNLYIENSPLFHLPKVQTPLVIMANDKDGAVPWYQGIELFTAMRRLNKPVWMLNYNDEAHNLVERRNRKDIQIREQQFFDWLLKGATPAPWLSKGIPALYKGRTWGL